MTVLGIGTDIVRVNRIDKAIKRTGNFIDKAFTEREICYLKKRKLSPETVAGFFAAKESVSKALGTGFRGFGLRDIEVYTNELGKPEVVLSQNIINILGVDNVKIHLSISHTDENAIAFAIIEEA